MRCPVCSTVGPHYCPADRDYRETDIQAVGEPRESIVRRNPLVIAGAMRELIEKAIETDGRRYGFGRLEELVNELEEVLTAGMFEQSLKGRKG